MIKIFSDGADLKSMLSIKDKVQGYTTNPSLMKKAGVVNYELFAKEVLSHIKDLPISFEVLSDDLNEMELQARRIASWGNNVYVKIPITNTKGESTSTIIKRLSDDGIKVNVTAILTRSQVKIAFNSLSNKTPAIISVFAGRISDAGHDAQLIMRWSSYIIHKKSNIELLWASTREIYNIKQAKECGCDIITVTPEMLNKMPMMNKDLTELSLDTVKMFFEDSRGLVL